MISESIVARRLQEQVLKERMVLDAILILASVEWTEAMLEKKLLEFDRAVSHNNDGEEGRLRGEILGFIAKLDREVASMDAFMTRYRRLLNEKKELLSRPVQKKKVYLRGVPPRQVGQA